VAWALGGPFDSGRSDGAETRTSWTGSELRAVRKHTAEVLDECDFELAVAHLRVPEMV